MKQSAIGFLSNSHQKGNMKKGILLLFVSLLGLVSHASQARFNANASGNWYSAEADYHVSPVSVSSLGQY